jgi:hypothetical protein
MKLGACYNVWDAEELLEKSIESIRKNASYVCIVWQRVSNFGQESPNPFLGEFLQTLVNKKLVDELIFYEPKLFSREERTELVSQRAGAEVGGPVEAIGNQFFNELQKRELGRQACYRAGCSHFMSMDTDEFYLEEELRHAMEEVERGQWDATACRMRIVFKEAVYEYWPPDEMNAVPLICRCRPESPLRLAEPYPVLLDPTRRVANAPRFTLLPRSMVEMYHMSFVRRHMAMKLQNTSNRANLEHAREFLARFAAWRFEDGPIHPHPLIGRLFTEIRRLPNHFGVDIELICCLCCVSGRLWRCSRCHQARYCSRRCQRAHWAVHKLECREASS